MSIKSDEADALARELSRLTGESLTDTVTESLRQRLERVQVDGRDVHRSVARAPAAIRDLPLLDPRSPDEILGYNETGHVD